MRGRGNAGSVESVENQTQVFHSFHRPLKIPRRDFHISTAPATAMFTEPKIKERKSAAARPPHFLVSALPPVGRPYFMLIFGLENAVPAPPGFKFDLA